MLNNTRSLAYFEVVVNNTTMLSQYTPTVRIIQETGTHPIALLDVVYVGRNTNTSINNKMSPNTWQYLKEDTPIQINYGQRPHYLYSFLGYVASYKLLRTGTDKGYDGLVTTTVQYTIVGTSRVMQSTNNVAWKNTSPSTIAANIATSNGLRSIVHSYASAITYRLQNSSDFKFLSQLADEIGFQFYVDNTDLYFINPQQILDRVNIRNVPQFWSYNQPGLWDTIRSFTPIVGTITPDGGIVADRNIVGLNPHTGKLVQASTTHNVTVSEYSSERLGSLITKFYNEAPAESYYEASQKITADYFRNIYWNTARAELRGDARVRPNTVVNLVGNSLPDNEAGLWLVQSAEHILTKSAPTGNIYDVSYTTCVDLIRDQVYTANYTALSETMPITQTVASKLVNGIWKSSNLGASIYAT